jgi:hypothetical protein
MTIDDNDGKPSRLLNHFSFERLKQWKHPPPFIGLGVGAFFFAANSTAPESQIPHFVCMAGNPT